MTELSSETLLNLKTTSTATLTTQLFRLGFRNTVLQGLQPLGALRENMVGPAFTLRYIPAREDFDSYHSKPDPNAVQRAAVEAVPHGHVFVMDCRQDIHAASAGDVYVTRLAIRGVAGLVTDGSLRDTENVSKLPLPTFCGGRCPLTNRIAHHALEFGSPIACGGVAVYPGDIIVGDADGVIAIPRQLADGVAKDAAEQERLEAYILTRVSAGERLEGLYPVNDSTRREYQASLRETQRTQDKISSRV